MTTWGSLEDATVVITGAAGGIGGALARGFVADGAHVVGWDLERWDADDLDRAGAWSEIVDVGDRDAVRAGIDAVVKRTGRLDVLINNAGIGSQVRVEDMSDGEFEHVMGINLFGPIAAMRAAIPVMRAQGYGRIVNVVSRAATTQPPTSAAYSASKAGLWAATGSVAKEVADADILVNALVPGSTASKMNPNAAGDPASLYPDARMLATLPAGGPSGIAVFEHREYRLERVPVDAPGVASGPR